MLGRLLLGQLALAHELVDQRMVLGQALQLPVAKQVCTTVADMRDREMRVVQVGGRERRAHPGQLMLRVGALVDLPVGRLHNRGQALLRATGIRKSLSKQLDGHP